MMHGRKKTVSVLIPEELYQELAEQAERSSRTLSGYIRQVLIAHLEYMERFERH